MSSSTASVQEQKRPMSSEGHSHYYKSKQKRSGYELFDKYHTIERDQNLSLMESSPAPKPKFRDDLGLNITNYILVPASGVALFCIYVYAEVLKIS